MDQELTAAITVKEAIANLQQQEDLGKRYYAAWWLGRFKVTDPAAVTALIAGLEDEADRAPDGGYPLRRNSARALGKLGNSRAVQPLINCLDCSDYYVREAAAQSLELLGDNRAIAPLEGLLTGGIQSAQTVPGKPHLTQPYEAIIEALGSLKAFTAIALIEPFLEFASDKIRYAATRAMYQLTGDDKYGEKLVEGLKNPELQMRRSALMDLAACGYLPAKSAIAATLAENSLKLIALKGLLETALESGEVLNPESTKIMELMDSLL